MCLGKNRCLELVAFTACKNRKTVDLNARQKYWDKLLSLFAYISTIFVLKIEFIFIYKNNKPSFNHIQKLKSKLFCFQIFHIILYKKLNSLNLNKNNARWWNKNTVFNPFIEFFLEVFLSSWKIFSFLLFYSHRCAW
jgi:hypothetical protein